MKFIQKTYAEVATAGKLNPDHLLRRYKQDRRRRRMLPHYEAALADLPDLLSPQAVLETFEKGAVDDFAPWLPDQTIEVVIAICTLGHPIDRHVREVTTRDMAAAAILEEILLAAVVGFTNLIHREIRADFKIQGLKAGPPYRPGVGQWPIEVQKAVFTRLPADKIGVTLTDELYMVPLQSTSLIIPITKVL